MQQQCQDREVIEVEVKEKVTIRKACACSFFLWLHYFSPQIEKSLAHATFVIFFLNTRVLSAAGPPSPSY